MKKFVAAAITAAIVAGFYAGASAQSVADKPLIGSAKPAAAPAPVVAAPAPAPAPVPVRPRNFCGGGLQCRELDDAIAQMQTDIANLKTEVAVLHQQLTDMQAQQQAPHSVADVPGR